VLYIYTYLYSLPLYVATAARGAGEVAELAAAKKCDKYTVILGA